MILSATGIVVDHYGDVLLIQRDDTRTFAPPGGVAEIGELPPETAAREVREETGLIVMAVRLVGLYYLPTRPNDYLSLCFRCIMRGGEIKTSEESPRAGFFKSKSLPRPMLELHQERIKRSLRHQGGAPYWGLQKLSTRVRLGNVLMNRIIYPWLHLRRRRAGRPPYVPPPSWQTHSTVIIRNSRDEVLWVRDKGSQIWRLPGGSSAAREAPWETAIRSTHANTGSSARLSGLSGVYPAADKPEMTFSFIAEAAEQPHLAREVETGYFAYGEEPEEAHPQHVSFVVDAVEPSDHISYRLLDPQQI